MSLSEIANRWSMSTGSYEFGEILIIGAFKLIAHCLKSCGNSRISEF